MLKTGGVIYGAQPYESMPNLIRDDETEGSCDDKDHE